MARRLLQVFHLNRNCVEFSGPNVREVYKQFVGRAPVFNTRTRRWVSTPDRVRDLVAYLEVRGWDVTVSGATVHTATAVEATHAEASADVEEPSLW